MKVFYDQDATPGNHHDDGGEAWAGGLAADQTAGSLGGVIVTQKDQTRRARLAFPT